MTVSPGRAKLLSTVTEAEWRTQVIEWARRDGWLVYAIHDSRKQVWNTHAGFPDLVLVRNGAMWAVELKTDRGRPTKEQDAWLAALSWSGAHTAVWRPSNEQEVRTILA